MAGLDRIRTEGFKRWYERQLIEGHVWLVTWFLAVIVVVSGIEVAGSGRGSRLVGALLVLGGLGLAVLSWHRYRVLLAVAERLGEQANCPKCRTYARFVVLSSSPSQLPDGGDAGMEKAARGGPKLQVRCRECGEHWMLH